MEREKLTCASIGADSEEGLGCKVEDVSNQSSGALFMVVWKNAQPVGETKGSEGRARGRYLNGMEKLRVQSVPARRGR